MELGQSILDIKNIGAERAKKLNKLGIFTVEDLIEYFPRDYDDRSHITKINEINLNQVNTVKGKITAKPETMRIRNMQITKARIDDGSGMLELVWFNQPYLKNTLKAKSEYMFTGKVCEKYARLQMESPEFEIIDDKVLLNTGRIIPVYASTYKFSQKLFRGLIFETLKEIKGQLEEFMPENLRKNFNLCNRSFAIENIHFPENDESFFMARRRLVFEELFLLQMHLLQLKGNIKKRKCGTVLKNLSYKKLADSLPFELTNSQKFVIKEIINEIKSGEVINRLIQGDVGSGKTAVAMAIAFIIINNGYQCAFMAPTDVLANQHFENFKNIFGMLNINCVLLTGSQKKREKKEIYSKIENGDANIVIGTHAVIQDAVKFKKLGLVITDEQHRFGVNQRNLLAEKGDNPHILVMSATPIPRSLALILYGDLDISIIDELPPGRQKIDTIFVNTNYRNRVYNFIIKNAEEGRQSYIICPMIEEGENKELKAVIEYTEKLKNEVFFNIRIECIHGKMKNDAKQEIMKQFSEGKIDVLVSTTVIEVGINVPNATIMLIENAERFGISQLHQLRGRVGRGSDKSYCILISDSKNKVSVQRLKTMTQTENGFEISEKDLNLRGPGDFFGTRQHGVPELKIANLYKDIPVLKEVQSAAMQLYLQDPELNNAANQKLNTKIQNFFEKYDSSVSL